MSGQLLFKFNNQESLTFTLETFIDLKGWNVCRPVATAGHGTPGAGSLGMRVFCEENKITVKMLNLAFTEKSS